MEHEILEMAFASAETSPVDLSVGGNPLALVSELAADFGMDLASNRGPKVKKKYGWLPFAAQKLRISPDIKDYIVIPVSAIVSDLPNRNLMAFPLTSLTDYNVNMGMLNYQTFIGKMTALDHVSSDPVADSKGIILDASLRHMKHVEGNLHKLVLLCAFDTTKDRELCRQIANGTVNAYSIGAAVSGYECSICGAQTKMPTKPPCSHMTSSRATLRSFTVNGKRTLAHWRVAKGGGFHGFETSALRAPHVKTPAYPQSIAPIGNIIKT